MNVRLWWGVAWRFLWRSRKSTGTLAAMIVTATATLIFLDALAVGVNDAMIRNSVSLLSGHITVEHLPADIRPEALRVPGVDHVLQRQTTQVWLRHGEKMAMTSLVSMEPEAEQRATALWRKTTLGRYPAPGSNEIFLGESVARDLGLRVGDTILAGDSPERTDRAFVLCGVFRTGIAPLDQSLSFCAGLQTDAEWDAAVFLGAGASPERVRDSLRLPAGVTLTTWAERMPDLKQLVDLNSLCMLLVMLLVFFIVSLGIACAFVIFILKNIREHGIMKSMGVFSGETVLLLVLEISGLTLAASVLGMALGCAATLLVAGPGVDLGALTSHNQYFAVSGIIYPRLTVYGLVLPPVLALFFALLAGIWPMCMVARQRPAEVLRSI